MNKQKKIWMIDVFLGGKLEHDKNLQRKTKKQIDSLIKTVDLPLLLYPLEFMIR